MQVDAEEAWITVPVGRPDTIVITVPTVEERSSDAPSSVERVESNQMLPRERNVIYCVI